MKYNFIYTLVRHFYRDFPFKCQKTKERERERNRSITNHSNASISVHTMGKARSKNIKDGQEIFIPYYNREPSGNHSSGSNPRNKDIQHT